MPLSPPLSPLEHKRGKAEQLQAQQRGESAAEGAQRDFIPPPHPPFSAVRDIYYPVVIITVDDYTAV